MAFQKAQRKKVKLRLGLCGPSGSGKTFSALRIANGFGGRIALIDTENNSAELYSDLCDYDVDVISPPFSPEKYIDMIHEAEKEGYDIIIIDSLSHAWAGEGGLLDIKDQWAQTEKNSYTAWRHVTPQHNKLVDAILQSPAHIIVTMRSKTAYVLEPNDDGKMVPRKVGMAPVQREGMDYEFTIVFEINASHYALATKDRTSMFSATQLFQPSEDLGKQILDWLNMGEDAPPRKPIETPSTPPPQSHDGPAPAGFCENCKENPIDRKRSEALKEYTGGKGLCEKCAKEMAGSFTKKEPEKPDQDKKSDFGGQHVSETFEKSRDKQKKTEYKCEDCGADIDKKQATESRIKTGKPLCQVCQNAFEQDMMREEKEE